MKLFLFVALCLLVWFQGQFCVDSRDCDRCEVCVATPNGSGQCVQARGCE